MRCYSGRCCHLALARLFMLLLLLLLLRRSSPNPAHYTGYKQLKPVSGQWKISVAATKSADKAVFSPLTCDQPALTAACNQPPLSADAKDKLRVDLALKDKTLKTMDDLSPKRLLVRACYTKQSATDRPWRRANDVIDVSVGANSCACLLACRPRCATAAARIPFFCSSMLRRAGMPTKRPSCSSTAQHTCHRQKPACTRPRSHQPLPLLALLSCLLLPSLSLSLLRPAEGQELPLCHQID